MVRAFSAYGGGERRVLGFGGKPEAKRPLWRTRLKWENKIKMGLQEVECGVMDWIDVA